MMPMDRETTQYILTYYLHLIAPPVKQVFLKIKYTLTAVRSATAWPGRRKHSSAGIADVAGGISKLPLLPLYCPFRVLIAPLTDLCVGPYVAPLVALWPLYGPFNCVLAPLHGPFLPKPKIKLV